VAATARTLIEIVKIRARPSARAGAHLPKGPWFKYGVREPMVPDVRIDTIVANVCYIDALRLAPQRCVRATDIA